jgi:pseudaminic acid biosynthesis-associated methylase
MTQKAFATEQESFWAGSFGTDYIQRNTGDALLAANLHFFGRVLRQAGAIASCLELGANVGMNLRALKLLYPAMQQRGIEINPDAARELARWLGEDRVFTGSIFDWTPSEPVDLAFTKGVLIHIHPDKLRDCYRTLYEASRRLILVCEYYNPSPVSVPYRGHSERLFKRDFAGELLDAYPDLRLIDYGFAYHRDPVCRQDDVSWFLMEKRSR